MVAWTLPNEGPLTETERREAMANFKAYIRRQKLNYQDVARHVNKPRTSTIRDLCEGTYTSESDAHIRTLNNWIEQHARQQAAQIDGPLVDTRVAEAVRYVGNLIRVNKTMGIAVGPCGIGKTRCAEALYATTVGSAMVTVIDDCTSPRGFKSALAEAVGVPLRARGKHYRHGGMQQRIIRCLQDSGRMLIIDEAHKLSDDSLEVLREIHDATGCPVFCLATKELNDRVERSADPDAGQLYSRFSVRKHLTLGFDVNCGGDNKPLHTVEQIRQLYEQKPIKLSTDAVHYLLESPTIWAGVHFAAARC